jgi:hypothetical protein
VDEVEVVPLHGNKDAFAALSALASLCSCSR